MGAHAHQFYYSQCLLSRRERLSLAVNPACSVFKYHGSWLKSDWGTKDILLIRQQDNQSISAHCAWLSLRLSEHLQSPNSSPNLWYGNNHDDNHPLFPLGLALIKLSLGCTLAKQEVSDGSNDGDDVASFGTAHQYIRFAHGESGRYADVVKRCLFWTDTADAELDDEHFQETMFVSIIMPLLDDLKAFEDVASRL
ncbi:hypothetical protein PHISCL_09451 [Aspergillus sclerotialis]|uniref:DUF7580 domain-containing protein n=1 Tax=Aspergillus sclerotialis TaxID=2070753 RepID=A0A3A2ZFX5_9EURO|nr:hypothetical protein PHISCL_09451 [Aspergillus sclerotialis]